MFFSLHFFWFWSNLSIEQQPLYTDFEPLPWFTEWKTAFWKHWVFMRVFARCCIPSKLFWSNQASHQGIHLGQAKVPDLGQAAARCNKCKSKKYFAHTTNPYRAASAWHSKHEAPRWLPSDLQIPCSGILMLCVLSPEGLLAPKCSINNQFWQDKTRRNKGRSMQILATCKGWLLIL